MISGVRKPLRYGAPAARSAEAHSVERMALGHAVDDIGEIGFGAEFVELCRLQHGIEDRGLVDAGFRAQKQEVLPCDRDAARGPFDRIVVDAVPPVAGIAGERFSQS